MNRSKAKTICKYISLTLLILAMIVLSVEALMPGKESSAQSGSVSDTLDDILTEFTEDTIKHVAPEELSILVKGKQQENVTIPAGGTTELETALSPKDTSVEYFRVIWSSDHPEIASVENGKVRGKKIGTAVIRATCAESEEIYDVIRVRVTEVYAETLDLVLTGDGQNTVKEGKTARLTAQLSPSGVTAKTVTFDSSDPSVATVSASGTVTGVSVGTAVLRATYTSATPKGDAPLTLTQELLVSVIENDETPVPVEGLSLGEDALPGLRSDKNELYLFVGSKGNAKAQLSPSDTTQTQVNWSTSDESVLDITPAGNFVARGKGTVTLTAVSAADETLAEKITVNVRNAELGAELKVKGAVLGQSGNEYAMTVKAGTKGIVLSPETRTRECFVRYASEDDTIAEVFENGTLSTYKSSRSAENGAVRLTVVVADNPQFSDEDGNLAETFTVILTVTRVAVSDSVSGWGVFVRKLFGHFGAFLVLGILAAVTAILWDNGSWKRRLAMLASLVVFGFTFACFTELLQMDIFTTGRAAAFTDVVIDCNGYMPAALIVYGVFLAVTLIVFLVRRKKKKK